MPDFNFTCRMEKKGQIEEWPARISWIRCYGTYFEMNIISNSIIRVIFGKSYGGGFCCIPDWKAGCELASYADLYWNQQQLTRCMKNKIDAVTVAYAIQQVSNQLNGGGKISC